MEQVVQLDQLVIDEALQPRRRGIDRSRVRSLMETPDRWPSVLVASLDGTLYLVDGFHRVAAARALGLTEVRALVQSALVEADLATMAYAANAHHGLPLTYADRIAYVEALAREGPYDDLALGSIGYLRPETVRRIQRRVARSEAATRQARVSPSAQRRSGSLPPTSRGARVADVVDGILGRGQRRRQRRLAGYIQRLAVSLAEGDRIPGWETATDAADALRAVSEPDELADTVETLGRVSTDVLAVALELGWEPEATTDVPL